MDTRILVARAASRAAYEHKDQKRKYTGEPYIVHCHEVAELVRSVGMPEQVIAAAWLHDVVEDCDVSVDAIYSAYGQSVGDLVYEVTDRSRPEDGNRAKRKEIDRNHLAAASQWGQTIKYADLISNTRSIVEHDRDFARVYLAEKRLLLGVMRRGHPVLRAMAIHHLVSGEEKLRDDL